jgi:4a-hydroxytetrahydrobiopterin dehydratase
MQYCRDMNFAIVLFHYSTIYTPTGQTSWGNITMNSTINDLCSRHCRAYDKGEAPLSTNEIGELAELVPEWTQDDSTNSIRRTFEFSNYYQTVAFVNAVAWIAHQEDHHPDIEFSYKNCSIEYSTHSIGGLSENDFICTAKIDALTR